LIYPTLSALMRACLVSEEPLDLDKHRGMAAQKATEMRRADKAETNSLPEILRSGSNANLKVILHDEIGE
jgi:hypothetical protein